MPRAQTAQYNLNKFYAIMVEMIGTLNIAISGLNSAVQKISASASNIANFTTTGSLEKSKQSPYTPLTTTSKTTDNGGVQTQVIEKTNDPFTPTYDPGSPFADENGLIGVPNISLAEEAVNLNLAEIQYKASASLIRTEKELSDELLSTLDKKA